MGFFFLLAGYFSPPRWSARDMHASSKTACMRLGLPLLAFGLILGPLTAAMVEAAGGGSFWFTFVWLWRHKEFINGPLWFVRGQLAPWRRPPDRHACQGGGGPAQGPRAPGAAFTASRTAAGSAPPESWPALHEEIDRLPARYRDPIVLCYLEGLSTEEAALRIGCPRGTVLSRLFRRGTGSATG